MSRLRLWHWMVAVIPLACILAVARNDIQCTPISPLLAMLYLCSILGIFGARRTGRSWRRGLLLGLFLGPIGVIIAWSKIGPDEWPERYGPGASDRRTPLLLKE
jgi:hypothetical protein